MLCFCWLSGAGRVWKQAAHSASDVGNAASLRRFGWETIEAIAIPEARIETIGEATDHVYLSRRVRVGLRRCAALQQTSTEFMKKKRWL